MILNIIVNGNSEIGLGHLYRCNAIAEYFQNKGFQYKFFLPSSANPNVLDQDYVTFIPNLIWENPNIYKKIVIDYFSKGDIILIDLIEREYIRFKFLSDYNFFISSITLFKFKPSTYFGNISFHPTIKSGYEIYNGVKVFSGKEYFILRQSILEKKKINHLSTDPLAILVTMGGADPYDLTSKVLDALDLIKSISFKCIVIAGLSNPNKIKIKHRIAKKKNFFFYENVENIEDIYCTSSFAIINGGNTRYELTYLEVPYFCISIHNTQFLINQEVTNEMGGINLGVYSGITPIDIANEILRVISKPVLLEQIKEKMKNNNLGNGLKNIYNKILNEYILFKNEKIKEI